MFSCPESVFLVKSRAKKKKKVRNKMHSLFLFFFFFTEFYLYSPVFSQILLCLISTYKIMHASSDDELLVCFVDPVVFWCSYKSVLSTLGGGLKVRIGKYGLWVQSLLICSYLNESYSHRIHNKKSWRSDQHLFSSTCCEETH